MSLEENIKKGFCLVSQELRDWIDSKKIITCSGFDESKIQPSSFEPTISDEIFTLDTEGGVFRPKCDEQIYKTLLKLPGGQRRKEKIHNGFEIKKGFTYLIPLQEKVNLSGNESISSSPKSSMGRLFFDMRLLADFNTSFDEVKYKTNSELNLWLLVQSLAFNVIVHPGLSLNQLRFFTGLDAKLNDFDIIKEYEKNPLLFLREHGGNLVDVKPYVNNGLQIHLDLSGKHTNKIVGLRARSNPTPIDLTCSDYKAEYYFVPILKDEKGIVIMPGEHYLFGSQEILAIPGHLNAELERHSHVGLRGSVHSAGFIDNKFKGILTFEAKSEELAGMVLVNGMPISKLNIFRTKIPEKLYGELIGSSYNGKSGAYPPKFFKGFDFNFAAKNYKKLSRDVLVQDTRLLLRHRSIKDGFQLLTEDNAGALFEDVKSGFFHSRYDCEFDEEVLQIIPYVIVFNDYNVFHYVRASKIEDYGDKRLFGKHSIGLGGHINREDGPDFLDNCIEREVMKEEVKIVGEYSKPKLVGTLMCYDREVDRVHFGIVYKIHTSGDISLNESSAVSGKMIKIREIVDDQKINEKFETWSRFLIPWLSELYKLQ